MGETNSENTRIDHVYPRITSVDILVDSMAVRPAADTEIKVFT